MPRTPPAALFWRYSSPRRWRCAFKTKAASKADAATARAEATEAGEKHAALSSSHERLGTKVRDLMET